MKSQLKLTLGALATTLLLSTSVAQAKSFGYYVEGQSGFSNFKIAFKEKGSLKIGHNSSKIALGYADRNFRFALDYQHLSKGNKTRTDYDFFGDPFESKHKLSGHSWGLSFIHDEEITEKFKPYVGVRISYNTLDYHFKDNFNDMRQKEKSTGFGGMIGANYSITENLMIGAGVEYNYLGAMDFLQQKDTKVHQWGANGNIRYWF